jgi:hypothetical protein
VIEHRVLVALDVVTLRAAAIFERFGAARPVGTGRVEVDGIVVVMVVIVIFVVVTS